MDKEAHTWGFNAYSLIEAAGRSCADTLIRSYPKKFHKRPRISVFAGTGNNGADAMVMLRYLILIGLADSSSSELILKRLPDNSDTDPWAEIARSLQKMKVPVFVWQKDTCLSNLRDILIDGISGTGLKGALKGEAAEMVAAINAHKKNYPQALVVSIDIPSGCSDEWESGMPIVEADITLAIESQKRCIYSPIARPSAATILAVDGIFPREIISGCKEIELIDWKSIQDKVPPVRPDSHKYKRGLVELRCGSPGTTGAALIAARGAQAAGAGLIHLVVDDDIYPVAASGAGGIMVSPESKEKEAFIGKFKPDAILLGPGWGREKDRSIVFEKALSLEKKGWPLILDADAIELAKTKVFNANTIITPHPGEFERFSGIEQKITQRNPFPVLQEYARRCNAVIVYKSHVIIIAAPDGRLGVVDGMRAGLASGGSGDLLAGFCAAIAARMFVNSSLDCFTCAAASAALLIASGSQDSVITRFTDPLELADEAADLAGKAWLSSSRGDDDSKCKDHLYGR